MKVFVDSDVVISSLISTSGAAHILLNESDLKLFISNLSFAHIVAGSRKAKVPFLISYNIKHYKVDKIKKDFNILVTTPANFLQYLRSLS